MKTRKERMAEAARLHKEGHSRPAIARKMGIGRTTVYGWLSEPPKTPRPAHNLISRERVIQDIQKWASLHNGQPPHGNDFSGNPEYVSLATAASKFGSWNKAIQAAGFKPRPPGNHGPHKVNVEAEEILQRLEKGIPLDLLMKTYKCSRNGILVRLQEARTARENQSGTDENP